MTSANIAPASARAVYSCGPVRLDLDYADASLQAALHGLLSQYDASWPEPELTIHVSIEHGIPPADWVEPAGSYLYLHHLLVDRVGSRLVSQSTLGVWMEFDLANEARIWIPSQSQDIIEQVEHQLVLLLARGWANAGWTPLHAGTLIPPGENRCALVCASSGAGKTTMLAALLRRGWRTLGDDKVLLRREGDRVIARSLARRFHLHPSSVRWFPEVGNVSSSWPTYSRWTDKRVVRIEEIWPDRLVDSAIPAAAIQLARAATGPGLCVEPVDPATTLNTLLWQIAIPTDAQHARPLLACAVAAAAQSRFAKIKIGTDAFADPAVAGQLEREILALLP